MDKNTLQQLTNAKVVAVYDDDASFVGVLSLVEETHDIKISPFVVSDDLKEKAKEAEMEIFSVTFPIYLEAKRIKSIIELEKPNI